MSESPRQLLREARHLIAISSGGSYEEAYVEHDSTELGDALNLIERAMDMVNGVDVGDFPSHVGMDVKAEYLRAMKPKPRIGLCRFAGRPGLSA